MSASIWPQCRSGWQSVHDEHENVDRYQPLGIYNFR
jgi:hypothetical protein